MAQACAISKLNAEMLHRAIHHTSRISQQKLGTFVERALQRLVGLMPPVGHDHGFKVGFQGFVLHHGRIKPAPDQSLGWAVVLKQLIVQRQTQFRQSLHRGAAQQGRKPAVKSPDLHRSPIGEYALV